MKLELKQDYDVIVTALRHNGAEVEFADGTSSFIHISQISKEYVKDPADYLSVGKFYSARAVGGVKTGSIQLSLKHLGLKNLYN